jgi:hypothetical protein
MPNSILLLGAGFSKNWDGLVSSQVTSDLMGRLQNDAHIIGLLNRMNFEDALAQLQDEYLRSRTAESEGAPDGHSRCVVRYVRTHEQTFSISVV